MIPMVHMVIREQRRQCRQYERPDERLSAGEAEALFVSGYG